MRNRRQQDETEAEGLGYKLVIFAEAWNLTFHFEKKKFCYKLKASFLKWVQSAWLEKENSYISTVWQHFHRMPWGIEHGIWDCYKIARWRQLAATTTFMKLIRGWTRNKVLEESNVQSASPSAESKAEGVVKVIFNWKAFPYVFNGENKTSLML